MNHIYRVIWNKTTNKWVVASELATSHGKTKSSVSKSTKTGAKQGALSSVSLAFKLSVLSSVLMLAVPNAYAAASSSHELGNNNIIRDDDSTVVGNNNELSKGDPGQKTSAGSHVVGNNVQVRGEGSLAFGNNAMVGDANYEGVAGTVNATAIGNSAKAKGANALAMGTSAQALGTNNTAIGASATITKDATADNIAFGSGAKITRGINSVVIGKGSKTEAANGSSIAIGDGASIASSVQSDGYAIGTGAKVESTNGGVAFGKGAVITNSSGGAGSSVAIGQEAKATGTGAISIGYKADTSGNQVDSIAIGTNATTSGTNNIAIGKDAKAKSNQGNQIVMGTDSSAVGDKSIVLGYKAKAEGNQSQQIIIGTNATGTATSQYSIVMGTEATASRENSTVLGHSANSTVDGGVALGSGSVSDRHAGGAAIGHRLSYEVYYPKTASEAQKKAIDATKATTGAVSLGSDTTKRQITNLAAGAADSDAVNVAQLKGAVTEAVASSNWNILENTTSKDVVNSGDNVSFANGTGTVANVTVSEDRKTSTVTYSVNKSGLNVTTNGTVQAGKTGDNFATAETVASAINESGFIATSSGNQATASVKKDHLVKPGSTVTLDAGKNLEITQTDGKFSFATKDDVTFTRVTSNTITVPGASSTGSADGSVVINDKGISAGNKTITNVAPGKENTDAVNVAQLYAVASKIPTVKAGDNVTVDTGTDENGQTVYTVNAAAAPVAEAAENYFHVNDGTGTQEAGDAATNKGAVDTIAGATGRHATAAGLNAKATEEAATAVGVNSKAEAQSALAVGNGASATGLASTAIGQGAVASGASTDDGQPKDGAATAVGRLSKATGGSSTALGSGATASNTHTVAVGASAVASGKGAIALGLQATAAGAQSVALGRANNVTGDFSGAVGSSNTVTNANTYVVGNSVETTQDNSVVLGNESTDRAATAVNEAKVGDMTYSGFAGLGSAEKGVVSVGKADGERQIINVAAGEISATSTDAINGSQLYSVAKGLKASQTKVEGDKGVNITSETDVNTGATTYNVEAKVDGTTVTINDKNEIAAKTTTFTETTDGTVGAPVDGDSLVTANTVAEAINNSGWKLAAEGVDGEELINPGDTATFETGSDNLTVTRDGANIAYDLAKDININSVQFNDGPKITNEGDNIKVGDKDGNATKITNVAAGVDGTDAVNVDQLTETNTTIAKGFNITADNSELANNATEDNVQLGETVKYTSTDGSIVTTVRDNEIDFGLGKDLTVGNDNEPGTIVVKGENGKDGVSINGKDGTIGLNGADGTNGTISVKNGVPGVNGQDGITRIVIDDIEVATMEDGLKFAGNTGDTINKKLNETLTVKGELAETEDASGANLRVDSKDGNLNLVMARDLTDLNSITINNGGPVINQDGINMNSKKITNLAPGVDGTDAVNVDQLTETNTTIAKGFNITADNSELANNATEDNVQLGETVKYTSTDGSIVTTVRDNEIDFGLGKDLTVGNDNEPGTIVVKGENGKDGVSINGKDGTIGLNGADGTNGTISVKNGVPGVNGQDGITRIVIDDIEVATMEDGLKFAGNTGDTINKKLNETLTVKGELAETEDASGANLRVDSKDGNLNLVMARDLTDLNSITINNGGPVINQDGINMNSKKITNLAPGVDGTDAVNVDQLTETNTTIAKGFNITADNSELANNATEDNVQLGETVKYTSTDGSIVTTVRDNEIDFGLGKDLTVGNDNEPGTIVVKGENGKDGVSINGKDGTIGLNGADGTNGTISVKNGVPGVNGQDGITRIVIDDIEVATMEDGLKFAGNTGDTINKKLNETLTVKGELAETEDASGANLRVDSKDGNLNLVMARDLTDLNSITINNGGPVINQDGINMNSKKITNLAPGVDGTDAVNVDQLTETNTTIAKGFNITADNSELANNATEDNVQLGETVKYTSTDGSIVTTVRDNEIDFGLGKDLTVGNDNEPGTIVVKGENGKDGVSINGKDGTIGLNGADGTNGTISVKNGVPGVNGQDGITRIVIDDIEVATMEDGLKFAGNTGDTINKKLNETLTVKGELAETEDASGANLRVDSKDGNLNLVMARDLTDLNSITINNGGPVINQDGINMNSKKITNLAPGVDGTDAVNVDQLTETNTTIAKGFNITADNSELANNATEDNVQLGETVKYTSTDGSIVTTVRDNEIDFGLGKDLTVGNDNEPGTIVVKGENGKDGVSINGKDGTIGLNGADGTNGTISVKNGVPGVNGQDGITRIVIDDIEVATMEDGLKFAGNTGDTINKKLNETLTVKGELAETEDASGANLRVDSKDGNLNLVMARDLTDLNSITINNGGPVINQDGINMNSKKITNLAPGVDGTDAVNVDQLTETNTTIAKGFNITADNSELANNATEDNVQLGETVKYTSTDGSIVTTVRDNEIDFGLGKDLTVGNDNEPGTIVVKGENGKDGVSINGKDGTIGLNGADGTNGTISVKNGVPGVNGQDGITRIVIDDIEVATMEDGLKFAGNTGDTINKKLNETLTVKGELAETEDASGANLRVDSKDGNLNLVMARDLTDLNSITINNGGPVINQDGINMNSKKITNLAPGVDGTDAVNVDQLTETNTTIAKGFNITADNSELANNATEDNVQLGETVKYTSTDGSIVTTVRDNEIDFGLGKDLTVGNDNEPGTIVVKGENGKDGVSINGKDGTIGLNGADGTNGTISVKNGVPGVNGQDGITRIVIDDIEVATMEDGLKFAGNTGDTINKKLNETLTVKGELAETEDASGANLRVDSKDGNLNLVMARDLTDLNSITINNGGPVINQDGINMNSKKITNLAPGVDGTDAVNVDQLTETNTTIAKGFNITADNSELANNATEDNVQLGETVKYTSTDGSIVTTVRDNEIDFGLGKDLTVGNDNEPGTIVVKGENGKDGVSINGKDGTIGLNGADGTNGTISVKNGVPGVNGQDGITRIVIDDIEVATMEDGLKFAGNTGDTINKKLNETLTVKGELAETEDASGANLRVDSKDGNLNLVMARDLTDLNSITINNGGPVINQDGINMNSKKITNLAPGVDGTDAVNVDQLTETNTTIAKGFNITADNSELANNATEDNVQLGETVKYTSTDGSIVTTVRDNEIDFGLGKDLTVGNDNEPGTIVVKGENGKDGVSINGKDGTIGLNGADGTNGTISVKNGVPGVNGQDGITRIVIDDIEVATMEDGLKFAGNTGDTINKKLNETLTVKGELAETEDASGANLRVDSKDGNLNLVMARDLTDLNSITINNGGPVINQDGINMNSKKITNLAPGVDGTDAVNVDQLTETNTTIAKGFNITADNSELANNATEDNVQLGETVKYTSTDGSIVTTVRDNEIDFGLGKDLTVGNDNEPGTIVVKGENGKDGVSINGKDGTIGLNGADGTNGTISVKNGVPGVNGQDGITRIVIDDIEVATMEDGLKFAGNTGDTINKKLNETLTVKGELAETEDASGANLRVDSKDGNLNLVMARDLTDLNSITINNDGPVINQDGINMNSKKITNLAPGVDGTDAVNVDQLTETNTTIAKGFNITADNSELANNATEDNVQLGETVKYTSTDGSIVTTVRDNEIDFGLGKDLTVGNDNEPGTIVVKGENGKDGVSINGKDGTIGLNGADGTNGTISVKNGVPGVNGQDGITRIVIDDIEVATMEDGLKFGANAGTNHAAKLNSLVDIKGADANTDWSKFDQGANIMTNVTTDANGNGRITVGLAKDLKGIDSITVNNGPVINGNGIDMKGDKITNVEAGTGDKDAVNVSQLKAVEATANKGWNLTTNGKADSKSNVKPGDTVDFANTDGNVKIENTGNKVTVNLNKDIDLTKDGSVTIGDTKVNNDGLTIVGGPSVTKSGIDAGDKKITNVADGVISATSKDAVNGSQLYTLQQAAVAAKTEVKAGDNVEVEKESGGNGQDIYTVSAKDTSASVTAGSDAITVNKADPKKVVTVDVTDYKVDLSQATKNNIQKGVDAKGIVDNKGLTFAGDKNSSTEVQKLGSTVNVNGDSNITTQASGNTVKVTLNPDVTVESVTATKSVNVGAGNAQVALTTKVGNDDIRELSVGHANAPTRITNVAPGVNGTDAVNVDQLKGVAYNISNRIDDVADDANAGVSSAMAMAVLPQAYIPGKSMLTGGIGSYNGEGAVAVGFSKLSDNGRWVMKMGGTADTQGNVGGAIGAGFHF